MTHVDPIIVSEHVRRRTETIDQRLAKLAATAMREGDNRASTRAIFRRLVSEDQRATPLLWHLFNAVADTVIDDYLIQFAEPGEPEVTYVLPRGQVLDAKGPGSAKPRDANGDVSATLRATQPNPSAIAESAGRCLLRTFIVNGRPLGKVTAGEATLCATSRCRDARFVMTLVDRALTPESIIGDIWTEDEVEAVYNSVVA